MFPQRFGSLTIDAALPRVSAFALGEFSVELDASDGVPLWTISHPASERPVWQNVPGKNFLSVARGQEEVTENRGSLLIKDSVAGRCHEQTIDTVVHDGERLVLEGSLGPDCGVRYAFELAVAGEEKLDFVARLEPDKATPGGEFNRLYMLYGSN